MDLDGKGNTVKKDFKIVAISKFEMNLAQKSATTYDTDGRKLNFLLG